MQVESIDTRQGTLNRPEFSNGNCLPYTGVPFAMHYFVPQTNQAAGSWFFDPTSHRFEGVRLTHQPSPWIGDYCHLLLTAVQDPTEPAGSYRPNDAIFQPAYLKIHDYRQQIKTELVPTDYGASFRYNFLESGPHGLLLTLPDQGGFQMTSNHLIIWSSDYHDGEDHNLKMYTILHFSESLNLTHSGYLNEHGQLQLTNFAEGNQLKIYCDVNASKLQVNLAASYIDDTQAALNLKRFQNQSFTDLRLKANRQWQSYLDRVTIQDSDVSSTQTFYTCFYRLLLFPQRCYELGTNHQPRHYDTYNQQVKPGLLYTNNGFWDTSRTVYPLFTLLLPELIPRLLQGFLNSFQETGYLPRWLAPDERGMMPGTLIDSVIANAAQSGLGLELMPQLFKAMKTVADANSTNPRYGRIGNSAYQKLGYLPADEYTESVNITQDYSYSDYCVAQVAKVTQQPTVTITSYQKRSLNFLNLVDSDNQFLRPKNKQGNFTRPLIPNRWGTDYTEGSAWQNSFAGYHAIPQLIQAMGGVDQFEQRLDALCNTTPTFKVGGYQTEIHEMSEMAAIDFGQLAISNQPSFHLPFLYAYLGKPAKTQVLVTQLRQLFSAKVDGFPGDEDNGSMAGWYMLACLGFYPVCPANAEFVWGIPAFKHVIIHFKDHDLKINADPLDHHHQFVTQIAIDGQSTTRLAITYQELTSTEQIDFQLGLVPTNKRYSSADLPK